MTDREKLIDLLNAKIYPREGAEPAEVVADFLLDNGVRLPVTCGECKHADEKAYFCNVARGHSNWGLCTYPDGYCDDGERRADNG